MKYRTLTCIIVYPPKLVPSVATLGLLLLEHCNEMILTVSAVPSENQK